MENSRLIIVEADLVSRAVLAPGQNLQIKHLDRVWNFKWKVCRQLNSFFTQRHNNKDEINIKKLLDKAALLTWALEKEQIWLLPKDRHVFSLAAGNKSV